MAVKVGLIFELRRAETRPGEAIHVTGAAPELGSWRPLPLDHEDNARSLRTSMTSYPCWTMLEPIWLRLERSGEEVKVEYKFVRDRRGLDDEVEPTKWEGSIHNRQLSLPAEDGGIWFVSHARWDCSREPAMVTKVTPRARWQKRRPASLAPEICRRNVQAGPWAAHYPLTPKGGEEKQDHSEPCWPIEAEFSACFQYPGYCEVARLQLEARATEKVLQDLQLENERLHALASMACRDVETLYIENNNLRSKSKTAEEGSPTQKKDVQEPQEEPQTSGECA